jgi:hypothetical protein
MKELSFPEDRAGRLAALAAGLAVPAAPGCGRQTG